MGVEFGALVTVSVSEGFSEREIGCVRGDKGLEYCFLRKKKGLICWQGCIALLWKESRA